MQETFKRYWQWVILFIVLLPLIILMVQGLSVSNLRLTPRDALQLFPYLGIAAWSVMWTHYIAGLVRHIFPSLQPSGLYSRVSHGLVTFILLAHPALLAFAQYELTGAKPPESYELYVGAGAMIAVTAGLIALAIFLSYDIYRLLQKRNFWQRQQWLVAIAQSLAMSLIFWHGLSLGQHLASGWFRYWWISLGVLLLAGQASDIKRALDKRFANSN